MHPLELREARFRLQQAVQKTEDGQARSVLEQQILDLQAICKHGSFDEDPEKGWRCRDCDLTRPPDTSEEPEDPGEVVAEAAGEA